LLTAPTYCSLTNEADKHIFMLNSFDDQEQNLTFVKTDFQVLKLKFHAAIISRLYIFFINYTLRDFDSTNKLLYKLFVRYLVVKPTCVNVALTTQKVQSKNESY